jgi:predicted RNA-binding Zn-ribbon protein involved in translation (DUF1610 family)
MCAADFKDRPIFHKRFINAQLPTCHEGKVKMKRSTVYKVNLTQIDGEGDFACPSCGTVISPDDETESIYTIVETKMKRDELEELIIRCNGCESQIHLVGFL